MKRVSAFFLLLCCFCVTANLQAQYRRSSDLEAKQENGRAHVCFGCALDDLDSIIEVTVKSAKR
jgi:hypothetical protein